MRKKRKKQCLQPTKTAVKRARTSAVESAASTSRAAPPTTPAVAIRSLGARKAFSPIRKNVAPPSPTPATAAAKAQVAATKAKGAATLAAKPPSTSAAKAKPPATSSAKAKPPPPSSAAKAKPPPSSADKAKPQATLAVKGPVVTVVRAPPKVPSKTVATEQEVSPYNDNIDYFNYCLDSEGLKKETINRYFFLPSLVTLELINCPAPLKIICFFPFVWEWSQLHLFGTN